MIIYSGEGYLALVFFMVPVVVVGAILYYGFGIDILRSHSWWPLHSIMMLGAILTFAIGFYLNRSKVAEITYERSGPVTTLKPRHTFYFVPLEYWGPIVLAIYFVLVAYSSFK